MSKIWYLIGAGVILFLLGGRLHFFAGQSGRKREWSFHLFVHYLGMFLGMLGVGGAILATLALKPRAKAAS